MLEISQFKKNYSTGFKLQIEDLKLDEGIHLIKGENGSGKSTLLKAIAGIHDFEGDINWNEISIKSSPIAFRKKVNYSDAEPHFPNFLSLDELIRFTLKTKGGSKTQVESLKREFRIGDFSKNPISSYSSGMLKKAGLILAFLGDPSLIILDEPFTTIDLEAQNHLRNLILSSRKSGVTFLITGHLANFESLLEYDSILEIFDGKITLA
ncbi:ABC transporter ATP-binding protein [Algoriphagus formosus]|uniref:ABC transporter ATP-binding protein n=1 Tax=Algoriphagus formosus TaxID=2007308 RepID=A0A4R5UWB1_9BACT|nr:ATP-binding cassette domain-containing protein [Algoriphagus aquimaris]TDK43421.1 ABC transporter ATP-binding protein [Algoriphagus aquimaris]